MLTLEHLTNEEHLTNNKKIKGYTFEMWQIGAVKITNWRKNVRYHLTDYGNIRVIFEG